MFKTRFFDFPHRGEWKKHPWDRIPRGRFHTTILGGLFPAAQKAGLTGVENEGPIWVHPLDRIPRGRFDTTILGGLFPAAQKAGLTKRSKLVFSTFPIGVKRKNTLGKGRILGGLFQSTPHWGETKKHPWNSTSSVHATILGELLEAAKKAGLTKVVQLRSKLVFSTFPIGAKRKNTLWIEFHEVGFIPPFWVGFSQQRKKPG